MTEKSPAELIESIATLVVMAEVSDTETLHELAELLSALSVSLEDEEDDSPLRMDVDHASQLVRLLELERSRDPGSDLTALALTIEAIQRQLAPAGGAIPWSAGRIHPQKRAVEGEDRTTELAEPRQRTIATDNLDSVVDGDAIILPAIVDEELYQDFLSTQKLALEEMERDLLSVESEGPDKLHSIRRRVHTMKGEAGIIDLQDLVKVCHAIEDFLELALPESEQVDRLLHVKDWIEGALATYSRLRRPSPSGEQVVAALLSSAEDDTGIVAADGLAAAKGERPGTPKDEAKAVFAPGPKDGPKAVLAPGPKDKAKVDTSGTAGEAKYSDEQPQQRLQETVSDTSGSASQKKGEGFSREKRRTGELLFSVPFDATGEAVEKAEDLGSSVIDGRAVKAQDLDHLDQLVEDLANLQVGSKGNDRDDTAVPIITQDILAEDTDLIEELLREGEKGLEECNRTLLDFQRKGVELNRLPTLMEVFHNLKEAGEFFELSDITLTAQLAETLLTKFFCQELELRGAALDLVIDTSAMMRRLIQEVLLAMDEVRPVHRPADLDELLNRLNLATGGIRLGLRTVESTAERSKLGEILIKQVGVKPEALKQALAVQSETGRRLGDELVASGAAEPKQIERALRLQEHIKRGGGVSTQMRETVKVDLKRVDDLVETIGELVIAEAMGVHAPDLGNLVSPRFFKYLSQLDKITRDLQSIGMRMRMVPLRSVFQKLSRTVRDLGRKSGKSIRSFVSGESTEMDRSMVEQIGDPLIHIIRNAVDHGIEGPQERAAAGKQTTGTITISGAQQGSSIVIEVRDDGRGLDQQRIVQRARELGLINDNAILSEAEMHDLILAPGFSTAKEVTEISGRGVGMDVVRRSIESMRGRIQVSSQTGKGTAIRLVLPLTLAIIDGMLVICGGERYIIPTLSIVESIKPEAKMLSHLAGRYELINIRGEIMPLIRLSRLFETSGATENPLDALVVVVECMDKKIGLMVDDVVTQQQVVIKNLGPSFGRFSYISGAAILSDGRVGLIVNVDEIPRLLEDETWGSVREQLRPHKEG